MRTSLTLRAHSNLRTQFSGTIPTEIGLLQQSLKDLSIKSNSLKGSIPSEIGLLTQFSIIRLNSDGSLDASFSGDGSVLTDIGAGTTDGLGSIVLQTDGKIIAAGTSDDGSGENFALVRYNTDGSLDASFDGNGKVVTAVGLGNEFIGQVALQADGKILVSGSSFNGSDNDFTVLRYNSDGTLDTSFANNGTYIYDFNGGSDLATSLVVQGDGGFLYGASELATAAKYGVPVVVLVYNDNAYGNVQRIQEQRFGHNRVIATDLSNPDIVRFAESFGIFARRVTPEAGDLRAALEAAFDCGGPAVVEVACAERYPDPWPFIFLPTVRGPKQAPLLANP